MDMEKNRSENKNSRKSCPIEKNSPSESYLFTKHAFCKEQRGGANEISWA